MQNRIVKAQQEGRHGKAKSAKWVLEGDIKGCFDNISHDWILKNIPLDKKLLKKWLRSGYIETKRLFPTAKGTAQGSPIGTGRRQNRNNSCQ